MLAECGRMRSVRQAAPIDADWTGDRSAYALTGQDDGLHQLEVARLRVGQSLGISVDRRTRNTHPGEALQPGCRVVLAEKRLEEIAQRKLVVRAQGSRGEARILKK